MFKISINTNNDCSFLLNNDFSLTKTKEMSDISIMYNGLVSDESGCDKDDKAASLGYKTTYCPDIYYDKQTKSYYRWNSSTKAFDLLDNAKKIYEDGAYLTKDKKLVLPTGSYEDKENNKFFNSEGKEIEERTFLAQRYKYDSTSHPFIYFDKAANNYKRWDGSEFYPTDIVKVNCAGGYETSDGKKYAVDGSYGYMENGEKKYIGSTGKPMTDNYFIRQCEAQMNGYKAAPGGGEYYYDSTNKSYLKWDETSHNFVATDVEEVLEGGYYKKQDKCYNSIDEEISITEYTARKNGMYKTNYTGIYVDKSGKTLFKWNTESNKFEKFDHEAKMTAYYSQKADGKIGNFEQGANAGDCWLLSAVYGLSSTEEGQKILKDVIKTDENGTVTVNLKGVGKQYTFTDEELNNVIKDDSYSYFKSGSMLDNGYYSIGDKDVLALELAIRNYRKELDESGEAAWGNPHNFNYVEYSGDDDMYTYSGSQSAAVGLLTGKNVNIIKSGYDENTVIKDGVVYKQKMEESVFKPIFDNPENTVFVSLYADNDEGHAYTFKSYDDNFIYLVNPYDTSKVEKMPKDEFYKKLIDVSYTDLKSNITPQQNKYKSVLLKMTRYAADKETLDYLKTTFPDTTWYKANK